MKLFEREVNQFKFFLSKTPVVYHNFMFLRRKETICFHFFLYTCFEKKQDVLMEHPLWAGWLAHGMELSSFFFLAHFIFHVHEGILV